MQFCCWETFGSGELINFLYNDKLIIKYVILHNLLINNFLYYIYFENFHFIDITISEKLNLFSQVGYAESVYGYIISGMK